MCTVQKDASGKFIVNPDRYNDYNFEKCPHFSGGIHWNGCDKWLHSEIDGDWYKNTSTASWARRSSDSDVCHNQNNDDYPVTSIEISPEEPATFIYSSTTGEINGAQGPIPDSWDFLEDIYWELDTFGSFPYPLLVTPQEPITDDDELEWGQSWPNDRTLPSGDSFVHVNDTYFYRVRHSKRNANGCLSYLGIDSTQCTHHPDDVVPVKFVGTNESQIIKWTLQES